MTRLERMRTIFISLLAVLLVADAALAVYVYWPGSTPGSRKQLEQQLNAERVQKNQQMAPLKGIDKKLIDTRAEIKKFCAERVPAYWSQISSELHKLEQANGIPAGTFRYGAEASGLPNLQVVKIDTSIAGDYVKIAHLINALERDKYLFLIDQVTVAQQAGGTVQVQVKFETFLKAA